VAPHPWWQTGVVYQIYPRSFQDSDGDGVGDLAGIISRLDHLSETLGVDALWLSPFYPSPMADFGYDVADYCDVDPLFGTLEDFDGMVAAAHARGLRVIVDWVPNHSSDQHPWFVESRTSRDNPKRDWYLWRDARSDGSPPNNWLSAFGGPAWTWDEATEQFYLHSFLAQQPDLNWRNPQVEAAMLDTLRFWLDRGVDGFRIDVAHFLGKDPEMRDNPPRTSTEGLFKPMAGYDSQVHLHDKGHPFAHDVFRKVRAVLDGYGGDRFAVGEIHESDWAKWAGYYGAASDELHMPFNFSLLYVPWDAAEIRRRVEALEAALPAGAWPNYVLGNHDEPRIATRFGPERARLVAMLLLTLRGTPTLYYGDEIAMPEVAIPRDLQNDPWALRVPDVPTRDGCRTPMQWAPGDGAGFTTAGVEPWLPFTPDLDAHNVAAQLSDQRSLLQLYRQLLRLRRSEPALHLGGFTARDDAPDGVLAYHRRAGDADFLVLLNLMDDGRETRIPTAGTMELSTYLDQAGAAGARVALRAHEGMILRLTPGVGAGPAVP
jgi:glycosidase